MNLYKAIIITAVIPALISCLWADTIDLEVYPTIKKDYIITLKLDGMYVGQLPVMITDLPTGEHRFTLTWIEDSRIYSRSDIIYIKGDEKRLYMPPIEDKSYGSTPFLMGLIGTTIVTYFVIFHLIASSFD